MADTGDTFEIPYGFNYGDVVKGLNVVEERLIKHEAILTRLSSKDPFTEINSAVERYNTTLTDGTRLYQQIEKSAEKYREEIKRIGVEQKKLKTIQNEAKTGLEYDEAIRKLEATKIRVKELQEGLRTLKDDGEKAGKGIGKIGDAATKSGDFFARAFKYAAAYFTLDTAVEAEKRITELTAKFEKYDAVLTNAFNSEQIAADALGNLSNLSTDLPSTFDEITESYIKLVNRGIVPTNAELIKQADLAASQGKSFDQLTEAILDGMVGENERLKEFGIRARTVGDEVILSFRGIEKQIKKTDEEGIRQAILSFDGLSGVAGSVKAQMQTLSGVIANVGDKIDAVLRNIGSRQEGLLHDVIGGFSDFLTLLKDLTEIPAEQKLRAEQAEFQALTGAVLLTNEKSAERKRLMEELVQKYPSLLGLIDAETVSNEGLARAVSFVNQQYEIKIRLAAQDVLAKRNAEQAADAIERQNAALKKAAVSYREYLDASGYSKKAQDTIIGNFSAMSAEEQAVELGRAQDLARRKLKVADNINAQGAGGAGQVFPTQNDESRRLNEQVLAIGKIGEAQKEVNAAIAEGVEIQKGSAKIREQEAEIRQKQIDDAQKELDQLTEKAKQQKLTTAELAKQAELTLFIGGAKTYGTPPVRPEAKDGPDKEGNRLADQRRKLLRQAEEDQLKYAEQVRKIELDSNNVRLQLTDKFSAAYLAKKRAFDQLQLAEERKSQVILFAESEKTLVTFKDASGKTQQELRSLLQIETDKLRAQGVSLDKAREEAISKIGANQFATSTRTQPVREILQLRQQLIDRNNSEDERVQFEKLKGERINMLGDGFDKEKAVIEQKYRELIATYRGNEQIIAELRSKQAFDIANARLNRDQKAVDSTAQNTKSLIDLMPKQAGETDLELQRRQQQKLLENDKAYYEDSLRILKTYLASRIYMQGIANGQVSSEQIKAYQTQIDLLEAQLKKAGVDLTNFTKNQGVLGDTFTNLWQVAAKGFTKAFGSDSEISKFFNDSQNATAANKLYDSLKGFALSYTNAEIEYSQERIRALESEISDKTNLLNEENEKRKQGLANNYDALKKSLDDTKAARDSEKENLKRNQKDKARIEALETASSQGVALANIIVAMSNVLKGASTIPFAGVALGLAGILTLATGFIAVKAKMQQATKFRLGKPGGTRLEGASHENGGLHVIDPKTGEIKGEFEGREWLMGLDPSVRHDELLGHINADTFRNLPGDHQRKLIDKLGVRFDSAKANIDETRGRARMVPQKPIDFRKLETTMEAVARNTANIPAEQHTPLGDGVVLVTRNGRVIGTIDLSEVKPV